MSCVFFFHFSLLCFFFFCWSSKSHGTGREGFYFSKFSFFLTFFSKITGPVKNHLFYSLKSSYVRVLAGQGLADFNCYLYPLFRSRVVSIFD
jgi:hypothetical protein